MPFRKVCPCGWPKMANDVVNEILGLSIMQPNPTRIVSIGRGVGRSEIIGSEVP